MSIQVKDLITKTADFDKEALALKNEGKSRQDRLHLYACSALNHANKYGDPFYLTSLLEALSASERPQELKYWVRVFGNGLISWSNEQKRFVQTKQEGDDKTLPIKGNVGVDVVRNDRIKDPETKEWVTREVTALDTPWWKLGKVEADRDKVFSPGQDFKQVNRFIERHAEAAEKAGEYELAYAYRAVESRLMFEFNEAMRKAKERKEPHTGNKPEDTHHEDGTMKAGFKEGS